MSLISDPPTDPFSPTLIADPYPTYARLLEREPWLHEATGYWVVARHADVRTVLHDPRFTRGDFRERGEYVQVSDGSRRPQQPIRHIRDLPAQLLEQARLNLDDPLFRVKDLRFVFFQFRRYITLGVHQRLFADIVRWNFNRVGVADLDVITEDFVETDLQGLDPRSFAFYRFQGGDVIFGVARVVSGLVQFRVESVLNNPWLFIQYGGRVFFNSS